MSSQEFEGDLRAVTSELKSSRADLLAVISRLNVEDLRISRRGGWSIRQVLQHVIDSERHYVASIIRMRGRNHPLQSPEKGQAETSELAARLLDSSRRALLAALDGVDEDTFYRLQGGRTEDGFGQEYSILSVLENVANHEREHAAQIESILALGG